MKFDLNLFAKGIIMGFADVLPGISGATIAMILNFYEKFIVSWDYVMKNLLRKKLISKELFFLINLYSGVLIGIFIFSKLMKFFLQHYKSEIYAFIVGLIATSGIFLIEKNKDSMKSIKNYYFMLLGLLLGFLTGLISLNINTHSNIVLVFSGFLAMCAMLLPGISGSYVLVMLNQYETVISLVNDFSFRLIFFLFGIILGLVFMVRVIRILLSKFHTETLCFLIGLIFGGLYLPLSSIQFKVSSIVFLIFGLLLGFLMKKYQ